MLSAGLGSPTVRLRSTSAIRVSAWHNSSKTFKMTPKEIVGKFVWLQVKRESFPCFFFKTNWKVYEIYRVLVIVLVLIFLPRVDDGTSSRPVFNWSTTEVLAWKDEGEFQPNNLLMALKFLNCSLVTDFYFYALIFCVNFENVIGHWYWYSCLPREAPMFSFCLKHARKVAFLLTSSSKQAEYNFQIICFRRERKNWNLIKITGNDESIIVKITIVFGITSHQIRQCVTPRNLWLAAFSSISSAFGQLSRT